MKIILLAFLLFAPLAIAMDDNEISLPTKQVLIQRLNALHLNHFVEKTNIIEDLAEQKLSPEGVVQSINFAIVDYLESLTGMPIFVSQRYQINRNRPKILEAVLQEHPAALEQLKTSGLYIPSKK
jgi:hypothetical protein